MGERSYSVVQWATGNIGTRSLQAVIEHPNFTLAGLWVHSPDKAGTDWLLFVDASGLRKDPIAAIQRRDLGAASATQ